VSRPVSAGVEGSPGHYRCSRRGSLSVAGRPRLRSLPRLDLTTDQALHPRRRRRLWTPLTMPPHQPGAAPANHDRSDHRATPHPGRQRTRRRTTHPRLAPPTPPPAARLTRLDKPPPPPRRPRPTHTQKRPKSSYIRFAAQQPNERWQADFTHGRLANGTTIEILCWLDDCSPSHGAPTALSRLMAAAY